MQWVLDSNGDIQEVFINDGVTVDVGVFVPGAIYTASSYPPQGGPPPVVIWVPIPSIGPPPTVGQPANQLHSDLHYSEYVSFEAENSRIQYRKIITNQRATSGAPGYNFVLASQTF
jgi:hypothetical protein